MKLNIDVFLTLNPSNNDFVEGAILSKNFFLERVGDLRENQETQKGHYLSLMGGVPKFPLLSRMEDTGSPFESTLYMIFLNALGPLDSKQNQRETLL